MLVTLGLAGAANAAATGDAIGFTNVPDRPKVGSTFSYTLNGQAVNASWIRLFIDNGRAGCAADFITEQTTHYLHTRVAKPKFAAHVHATFKVKIYLTTTSTGAHYLCAYLFDPSYHTEARATAYYVTRRGTRARRNLRRLGP
jgi:hypothetical protein